jgi:hypothetical protein
MTSFFSILIVLILAFPLVMRLSRNIYINMFVTYNPKARD